MTGQVTKAKLRYKVGYIREGKRVICRDWKDRLITDAGMNKVATVVWANCFTYALFGNAVSPTPTERDSGTTAFNVSGTNCQTVGGANFFVSSDVGRLIKFDDVNGTERYITAYINAQNVTLSSAATISNETACIWYVNTSTLGSLLSATNTYGNSGGDNGTTVVGNIVTCKRTFIGSAVVSPVTLTEIGFNNTNTNTDLFDRDIITGGIALTTGDQPFAVCELIREYEETVAVPVGNVGTGIDTTGYRQLCAFFYNAGTMISSVFSSVSSTGLTLGGNLIEPAQTGVRLSAVLSNTAMPSFTTGAGVVATINFPSSVVDSGYVAGNFYRDTTCIFNVLTANTDIYGFAVCDNTSIAWYQKFDNPYTKLPTQQLTVVWRKSWRRILVNP